MIELEFVSAEERALLVEMDMYRRMDSIKLLQTSHATEAQHGPLASSNWRGRVLRLIVLPAAGFMFVRIAADLHPSAGDRSLSVTITSGFPLRFTLPRDRLISVWGLDSNPLTYVVDVTVS